MKKEVRFVDEKKGVVRITTNDERWYSKIVQNKDTALPEFKALPSVTWIVSMYPKLGLQRVRDEIGADEMELLKKLGGERGSKVHDAITAIIEGLEVRADSEFLNPNTGLKEQLTEDEVRCISSFVAWKNAVNPKFLLWDQNIYSEKHGYAGTLDAIAEIEGEPYLIDFKTSKVIGTDYEMQVSAYREAIINGENKFEAVKLKGKELKMAILQVGTKPLKTDPKEYKWREVENCFELFKATKKIWENVYKTQIADLRGFSQKDYPIVLSPAITVEELKIRDWQEGEVEPKKAVKKEPANV